MATRRNRAANLERVRVALAKHPTMKSRELWELLGMSESYFYTLRKEIQKHGPVKKAVKKAGGNGRRKKTKTVKSASLIGQLQALLKVVGDKLEDKKRPLEEAQSSIQNISVETGSDADEVLSEAADKIGDQIDNIDQVTGSIVELEAALKDLDFNL